MNDEMKPERFFIFFSFIIGLFLIIFTPLGAGFDEDTHLARIWEMSSGKILPNSLFSQGPNLPSIFFEISYRQKGIVEPIKIANQFNVNNRIDWSNMILYQTRSTYFPSSYIIQAILMGLLGRVGDFSVNIIYFILRFSYLLIYIILVFLSIKIMPFGKWLLVLSAIAPMALIQSTIISPDSIVNGSSFLFIAWILHLKYREFKIINKKEIFITVLLSFILCSIKPNNFILLFLLVLIPKEIFNKNHHKNLLIFLDIIFSSIIYLLWFFKVSEINQIFNSSNNINAFEQLSFVFENPINFFSIMLTTIIENWQNYIRGLIGVFGYNYYNLPNFVYYYYLIILLIFPFLDKTKTEINKNMKLLFSLIIVIYIVFTFFIFYCMNNEVSSKIVDGVQGRYFIPLILLFELIITPKSKMLLIYMPLFSRIIKPLTISILGIVLTISIYFGYYIDCGIPLLNNQSCYLPNYKNWNLTNNNQIIINPQNIITQTFKTECNLIKSIRFVHENIRDRESVIVVQLKNIYNGKIYFEDNFILSNIIENDYLVIDFPKPIEANDDQLQFEMENLSKDNIYLGISERDDYLSGELYLNGIEQNTDLLFKYECY